MGESRVYLFIVLAALIYTTSCQPWQELIPKDKEVVYNYHALVKAGTEKPHPFASTFVLEGKLHVRMDSTDMLLLRLSDLKYMMDNGNEGEARETVMLPMPDHMGPLMTTFMIKMQESGKAKGLVVEEKEPEFVVNMKKAIGSMLQLDFENIKLDSVKPHAFISKEKSIFGEDDMMYNVMPQGDELMIQKMHEMTSSHHLYQDMITNAQPVHCEGFYEDILSHDSQRRYTIKRTSDQKILQLIESNGGVYLHPHQAQSIAMYVYVNQTLTWKETIPKSSQMEMKSMHKYDNFETDLSEPFEIIPDKKTLVPVVKQMLGEIVDYMNHEQIELKRPDLKQGHLINRIHKVMIHLDMTMWKEIFDSLKPKTDPKDVQMLTVFYDMLPLIGTRDSIMFIVSLVKEKQVKDEIGLELLRVMPAYIRKPSDQTILDLEALLQLDNLGWEMKKTAILSFSNALNKLSTYKHKHFLDNFSVGSGHHHNNDDEMKQVNDGFEKYIAEFINKIKTSQKREEQLLYIEALHNIKTDQVLKQLEAAVKGEWWNDNDLRLMSMWAVAPVVVKYPDQAYKLFWPIFTDKSLPMELRATSMFILMKAQPNLSRLINIYWFMQNETNREFYGYYYSILKAISETTDPCSQRLKLYAKQLLIYTPMPYLHGLSGYWTINYHDMKFNFGHRFDLQLLNTDKTLIMSFTAKSFRSNIYRNIGTIYMKISGLGEKLLDNFKLNLINNLKVFNYDELKKTIDGIPNLSNVRVEVTFLREDQVVEFLYFDSSNMKSMMNSLSMYYESHMSERKDFAKIIYETYLHVNIPTEIGFPVVFAVQYPMMSSGSYHISKEVKDKAIKLHFEGKLQTWKYGSIGLVFHNSVSQVWQGVGRFFSYDFVLPMSLDVVLNMEQQTLMLTRSRNGNGFAGRSHVANMVFVKDYIHNGNLKKTSPNSHHWVLITHNDKYKSEPMLVDSYTIFDADNAIAEKSMDLDSAVFEAITPLDLFLLKAMHKDMYMTLQPDIMMRGIYRNELETDKIDDELMIRLNMEMNNEVSKYLPAMKINTRITYTSKKDNTPTDTVNMNALLDINDGHTRNSVKMQITYLIAAGGSYKICAEGSEAYSDDGITGYLDLGMSTAVESKCTKDDRVMYLNFTGNEVPTDMRLSANYEICHMPIWSPIHGMKPYSCYAGLSTVRDYVIKIKTKKMPEDIKAKITSVLQNMISVETHKMEIIGDKKMPEQEFEMHLKYPMNEDVMSVEIYGPELSYRFANIKRKMLNWHGLYPDNTQYSNLHKLMHMLGLNDVCMVDGKELTDVKQNTKELTMTDWMLLIGESAQNTKHGVWIKAMDGKMALKIVHENHILLVLPHKGKFTITLDGTTVDERSLTRDWFHYDVMIDPVAFVYLSKHFGVHIVFNGDQIQMEIPKSNMEIFGLCYDK